MQFEVEFGLEITVFTLWQVLEETGMELTGQLREGLGFRVFACSLIGSCIAPTINHKRLPVRTENLIGTLLPARSQLTGSGV